MKSITSRIAIGLLTVAITASISIIPAYAETPTTSSGAGGANSAANQAKRLQMLGTRGTKEIDVRVDSLNKLVTRIQGLRNVSDSQKTQIVTTLQNLITNLTTLRSQITAEASTTALKGEVAEITKNYRVYALAIPQLNIFAASDRIITIAAMMNTIGSKLQARLQAATGVPNIATLQSDLTDMGAKIADANTQAQAAVAEVSPLVPDEGDKTKMASNTAALKDARTKIQAAEKDLAAARTDAKTIIEALVKSDKSIMSTGSGSATGTSTGTTTQ